MTDTKDSSEKETTAKEPKEKKKKSNSNLKIMEWRFNQFLGEKLTYQQGGREMLEQFLQIGEEIVTSNLNVHREVEYDMSENQIRDLLLRGSLDAFLDALDFAPLGVIDLIKSMSVSLPLTDLNKRKALKEKTGFDVDKALTHIEEEKAEEGDFIEPAQPERRVKPQTTAAAGRRTATNYKVISKKTDEE